MNEGRRQHVCYFLTKGRQNLAIVFPKLCDLFKMLNIFIMETAIGNVSSTHKSILWFGWCTFPMLWASVFIWEKVQLFNTMQKQ